MKYIFAISAVISFLNIVLSLFLYSSGLCILNPGVAFGVDTGLEVLISTVLIIFLVILGIKRKRKDRYLLFSFSILGLSNLIVRVIYDGVCDYISLFGLFFNLADVFIVLVCIYIFYLLIKNR